MKKNISSPDQEIDLQLRYLTVTKSFFTAFLLFCSMGVWGQIAAWDFSGQSSPVTFAASTFNTNLITASNANQITRGSGATSSMASNSFRTIGFQNNGISTANTDYFQTTLTAKTGYKLSLSTIDAKFGGTTSYYANTGVMSQFAYSLDGSTFTLIGLPSISTLLTLPQIDLSVISALQNVAAGTTITLRYYASGQTATGGWGFQSAATAGTNGLAIGGSVVLASSAPTVTITIATSVTETSAISGGNVTADGGAAVSARGVYFGTTAAPTTGTSETGTTGSFVSTLSPLTVNTQYFYRAYATNSVGTSYGTESSFFTLANVPSAPTVATPTSTSLNVTINSNGNPASTEYAIHETGGNFVQANGSLGATAVWQTSAAWGTKTVTGLSPSTTYTFETKARNGANVETGYSGTASGTTLTPATLDYWNLQFPGTTSIFEGQVSENIYAQAFKTGSTGSSGPLTGLQVWIGYSKTNQNPNSPTGWTWISAPYFGIAGNNDEFKTNLGTGLTPGTYYYASRFQLNGGSFVYGGYKNNSPSTSNGGPYDGVNNVNGILTVKSITVDYANIQSPFTGNIAQGVDFNVYARVFKDTYTQPAGSNPNISAWIGVSTTNASNAGDFATASWTWIPANFNVQVGNDDEYFANIAGATRPTGTYYYVSRFQVTGSSEYRYGGTNNNFWTGTANSGVLNIYTAPVITSALTKSTIYGVADTYTITATGSTPLTFGATGLPAGLSLNTATGVISGIATANVAAYNVTISATNGGATDSKTLVWTITKKPLTISGLTGVDKIYDGTTSATLSGTPVLNTTVSGDDVSIAGTPTSSFASKTIGTVKPITVTGYTLGGSKAGNYAVSQPTGLTANITAKALTVTGATAQNKFYDGTTAATITGAALVGVISTDVINVSGGGTFASAIVNTGIAVTASLSLAGADSGNYTLTQPTGLTADITKANPVFTTTVIAVLVGGNYILPGANITSTSNGALSYSMTDNAAATLTGGNTINGISVGTNTLTINQTASANYNAGSIIVDVNVSTVVYNSGDYRSTSSGLWNPAVTQTAAYAKWDRRNSSNGWDLNVSPPATSTANTIYIQNSNVVESGTSYGSTVKIYVQDGGKFVSQHSATANKVYIYSGGTFEFKSNLLTINSLFEIEDGGNFIFNYSANAGTGISLWNGKEIFHPNSNFIINDHKSGAAQYFLPIPGTTIGSSQLSPNTFNGVTAFFGNLIIDSSSGEVRLTGTTIYNNNTITHGNLEFRPNSNHALFFGTGALNLTIGKDFIIGQNSFSSGTKNTTLTTVASTINIIVKGNFINSSANNLRLVNDGGGNVALNIDGNMELKNGAALDLKLNASDVSAVNLKGDLLVDLSSKLSSSQLSTFNFVGTGNGLTAGSTQTIDVGNPSTVTNYNFNVNSGSYTKLINQNLSLGTNSKFNVLDGGTLDFGFNGTTALNILAVGNGQTFSSAAGSELKITSPEGINSTGTAALGNVQTPFAGRTFDPVATYHYIGKANQFTGSGLPKAASNKKVIVELEQDNLEFKSDNGIIRFNNPNAAIGINFRGLEIRKGTVISDNVGNRFEDSDITGEKGNLKMTGGIFKLFAKDIQPSLSGIYELSAPSKIDFALTDGADTQSIRSGPDYIYPAIDVSGKSVKHTSGDNINLKSAGSFTVKNGGVLSSQSSTGQIVSNDVNSEASLIIESNGTFATQREKGFYGQVDGLNPSPSVRNNMILSLLPNSTVDYSRSGDQLITAQLLDITPNQYNYQNLTISGSGIKTTAEGIITVKQMTKLTSAAAELLVPTPVDLATPNVFYALGGIDNTNGTTGLFHLGNDAQLMQNTTSDNTRAIIQADRNATIPVSTFNQYVYFSSPVVDQNYRSIFPGKPTTAISYKESTDKFIASNGNYVAGKSLAVRNPIIAIGAPSVLRAEFKGAPYNSDVEFTLDFTDVQHGYNLVGNPYPSNLDLNALYNNSTNIESTFRFWDNTANVKQNQEGSTYNGLSYAIYNALSGTGGTGIPAPGSGAPAGNNLGKVPNQFLKVGQGFLVRAKSASSKISFKNGQRTTVQAAAQFFGKNAPNAVSDDRYLLEFVTPSDLRFTNAVVYFANGNNNFGEEDSKFESSVSDGLFTQAGEEKVVINGRSTFEDNDILKVGNRFFTTGTYQIRVGTKEGIFATGQNIYLKDKSTGIITNLSQGNYSFSANAGEQTGRFEIIYKPESVLSTNQSKTDDLIVFKDGAQFVVRSQNKKIDSIEVFDSSGRLYQSLKNNSKEVMIDNAPLPNGVYILKIKRDNEIISKKIIR